MNKNHVKGERNASNIKDEGSEKDRGAVDLDLCGNVQFGCLQLQQPVQPAERQDRDDDGKITDQGTDLESYQGEQGRGEHGRRYSEEV